MELVNYVAMIIAWKKYGIEESFRQQDEPISLIICERSFWQYAKYYLSIFVGQYTEYLGIELGTVFCGFYNDLHVTAAYLSFFIWMSVSYNIGKGFAMVTRTTFGRELGEKKYIQAKRNATLG